MDVPENQMLMKDTLPLIHWKMHSITNDGNKSFTKIVTIRVWTQSVHLIHIMLNIRYWNLVFNGSFPFISHGMCRESRKQDGSECSSYTKGGVAL